MCDRSVAALVHTPLSGPSPRAFPTLLGDLALYRCYSGTDQFVSVHSGRTGETTKYRLGCAQAHTMCSDFAVTPVTAGGVYVDATVQRTTATRRPG